MKILKYLINSLYCSIFHSEMMFQTMANENLGEYVDNMDLYVLAKYGNWRTVIFKKYLIWK